MAFGQTFGSFNILLDNEYDECFQLKAPGLPSQRSSSIAVVHIGNSTAFLFDSMSVDLGY